MRQLVDITALVAAVLVLAVVLAVRAGARQFDRDVQTLAAELRRFQQVLRYQAIAEDVPVNARGWPETIDPAWFDRPPLNPLLDDDRPWVEIVPPEDAHLLHPRVRVGLDGTQSAFWYNPYLGVLRARVPPMVSDQRAAEIYNRVNGTSITSIFALPEEDAPPAEPVVTDAGADSVERVPGEQAGADEASGG